MRKSRTFLDRYSLEKIYISFIRPLMEYADVIWDNQKQNLINKLENIQLDAARIVSTVYINNIVYLSSIMGVSGTYSFWN
jgi:hypothetical protein